MNVAAIGFFEMLILLGLGGGFGLPLGIPPEPPDPVMARIAPEDCLFYVTWAGVAKPDPTSTNQTEQLLAEPEIQQLVAQLEPLIKTSLARAVAQPPGAPAERLVEDATQLVRILLTRPVAAYLADVRVQPGGPPEVRAGLVVGVGERAAEVGRRIRHHQDSFLPGVAKEVGTADVVAYQLKLAPDAPVLTWGVRGKYLFAAVGEGEGEALASRAKTPAPAWLATAAGALTVDRPASLSYVNTKKIVELVAAQGGPKARLVIDMIGLGNVTALASMTGLDKEGFVSRTLLRIEGQPQGIFALASEQGLRPADLRPIPADATLAVAAQLPADRILPTVLGAVQRLDPSAQMSFQRRLGQFEQQLGVNLQQDILQSLGPTWCLYSSPSEGGFVISGATVVIQVKDHQRLAAAHAKLLGFAEAALGDDRSGDGRGRPRPKIEEFRFADRQVYFVNVGQPGFPIAPSWCLTENQLIIATFPQNIKAVLSQDPNRASLATVPAVDAVFGPEGPLLKLAYHDTPKVFEIFYPFVPFVAQAAASQLSREGIDVSVSLLPSASVIRKHLRPGVTVVRRTELGFEVENHQTLPGGNFGAAAPVMAGFLLPAVSAARGAARRTQSVNNMRQIGLGVLNYESTHRRFPPAYIASSDGKPLLSWRVAILPYLGQSALHEQFHLDEPWDSPHNKRLLSQMPPVFASPGSRHPPDPGKTNYLTVRGQNTVFAGGKGTRLREIVDGTSRTIMTVEVNDSSAVPWTKPEDLSLDPKNPVQGLIGLRRGGFNVGFCDGSVRFLPESLDQNKLLGLFRPNDGQPVGPMTY